jgi:hypothetical protein
MGLVGGNGHLQVLLLGVLCRWVWSVETDTRIINSRLNKKFEFGRPLQMGLVGGNGHLQVPLLGVLCRWVWSVETDTQKRPLNLGVHFFTWVRSVETDTHKEPFGSNTPKNDHSTQSNLLNLGVHFTRVWLVETDTQTQK